MPEKGFAGWKLLVVALVLLTIVAVTAGSLAVWWARTVVSTSETQLDVGRKNVEAAKDYGVMIKKALDARTQEAAALRDECERLRAELAEMKKAMPEAEYPTGSVPGGGNHG